MDLDKPKGIVAQVAKYTDSITQLRLSGYTWDQIVELVVNVDADLGKRVAKNTVIRAYYLRALKKLAGGTLIVEQESLTKAKRGPKPKITAIQDSFDTKPEQTANTPTKPANANRSSKPVVLSDEVKPSSELAAPTPQTAPSTSDLVSRLLSGKTRGVAPVDTTKADGKNVFYIDLDD